MSGSRTSDGLDVAIEDFRVDVHDRDLADLRDRVRRTRWPVTPEGAGWDSGVDLDFLRDLCTYWSEEFDWRSTESRLNSFSQVRTVIDGERMHAVHVRSPVPHAIPLLMTHGWPGSVLEFLDVIGPLSDPAAFGLPDDVAFHVVCPSIPGFGWSGPTTSTGWDVGRVARAEATLMSRLGYERFGAQGGDWGSFVTTRLAVTVPERLVGIHLNFVPAGPPDPANPLNGLSESDRERMSAFLDVYQKTEAGYVAVQSTKPQSLGVGLNDSPSGLAAWIVEKFRTWSDCNGDLLSVFTRDQILGNVSAYWLTGTATSAARLYFETARNGGMGLMRGPGQFVDVPTGCAMFPAEIYQPPRDWVARQYDLRQYSVFEAGGHFAAWEQPDAFVADVRSFFRGIAD